MGIHSRKKKKLQKEIAIQTKKETQYIYMYKQNALNLRFRQINSFQPPEEHDLPVMRPTYAVRILFKTVWYPPRPLPEHTESNQQRNCQKQGMSDASHTLYKLARNIHESK